jgi:hypothetical protein
MSDDRVARLLLTQEIALFLYAEASSSPQSWRADPCTPLDMKRDCDSQ